jgi:predicted anti-sigma-YlaC factor YlaD
MHDGMVCHDLLQHISEYVDGSLRVELCAKIEEHLHGCEDCRIVINTLKKTVELYRGSSVEECELPEAVRSRLFARLDLEDFVDND